ncbi:MAG TPA: putative metallopeptidase [Thermoanaerobaculia bacterium]|jgi:hypothetical protein|nr:putative metallopeptidase [Thermoanaerobaculia bacterium]
MSDKEPLTWWRAREAREIAEGLISEFHEHLQEALIRYVFRSKHTEAKGRIRLASVRLVGGLNAYLAQADSLESIAGERPPAPEAPSFYLMEIAHDTWMKLTGSQRIALVDHELSHISPAGLVGHDVEEFSAVIQRHGAWKPDLTAFLEASKQQPLFESSSDGRKWSLTLHPPTN